MELLRGATEIAKEIGANRAEIPRLVLEEKLPAYKRGGKGPWLARRESLAAWLKLDEERHLVNI